jgi:hypothetical protein
MTLLLASSNAELPSWKPVSYGAPDFVRAVFLNEVGAAHGDFGLVGPRSNEFSLRAGEYGSGIGVDEQLR